MLATGTTGKNAVIVPVAILCRSGQYELCITVRLLYDDACIYAPWGD